MKAVIFDLDGVLVSTDQLHFLAWKKLADSLQVERFTSEDNLRQRGVSRMASLEIVLEKAHRQYSQQEKEELAHQKNEYYKTMLKDLTQSAVLPGAKETLEYLRSRGVSIAVGSVSRNAPLILEKTGLIDLIDQVSCGLDTGRSKPAPDVFLIAADKLCMRYENCMVVEDADAGIQAAKAARMKVLAVGAAYGNHTADYRALSLADPVLDWPKMLEWDKARSAPTILRKQLNLNG